LGVGAIKQPHKQRIIEMTFRQLLKQIAFCEYMIDSINAKNFLTPEKKARLLQKWETKLKDAQEIASKKYS
jgi:hypothetical protein